MNSVRSQHSLVFAAFFLGVLIAVLLNVSARSAEAPGSSTAATSSTLAAENAIARLFEVSVHRYVPEAPNSILEKRYLLTAKGELRPNGSFRVPVAVQIPPEAFDKVLIAASAQLAYAQLSPNALDNFIIEDTKPIMIADRMHFEIEASPDAKTDVGAVINLSSRGLVSPGRPLTGGFIVHQQARTVLVRGIGPTLAAFGVTQPLANPFLTIYKGNLPHYINDDWGSRFDADTTAAVSARVGAFALPSGSRDAALVIELPPGAYTAHVASADSTSGEALVEIYIVP
ncbi:hypothetical protein [Horticoccus sp. 23ND18S-11]|uniref:hypothetical protein n=1 Tax=Horticoccus sp. 23ND18S-11 TaxID=3391832 RepID=UPI0039C9E293